MPYINTDYKDIPLYEGKYACTITGKVISLKRWRVPNNRILKPWIDKTGYLCVGLQSHDKKQRTWQIHRLIAMTWLEDFSPELHVNHIDGDKTNNRLSNLEMVTPAQNMAHAIKIGPVNNKKKKRDLSKLNENTVNFIRKLNNSGLFYQKQIAKYFDVPPSTINDIIKFRSWSDI